ncbi:MAG TPA: hypothetical protein VHE81_01335 [Lacipirellulaceae bacterium]|nr:hypothetical protein [Lacipirellulaceae bacterium]
MTPGELVKAVAEVLGMPEMNVIYYDRKLVEAGLRSKHGRGRGAAHVTSRDAAHLLTSILGSMQVKDAVATVRRYSATRPEGGTAAQKRYAELGLAELAALPSDHSLVDALEALIIATVSGSLHQRRPETGWARSSTPTVAPDVEVWALAPGTVAEIRISGLKPEMIAIVRYGRPTPWDGGRKPSKAQLDAWEKEAKETGLLGDLETQRRITTRTLVHVAQALSASVEN